MGPVGLSLQVQLTAVGLDGWVPLLWTCRVEFPVWVHRWVGFAAVGLGIRHDFQLSLGCIHRVGLGPSPSGWTRRGWVGFTTVGLGICCGWVSLAVVGLNWPRRVGFVAV